MPPPRPAHGGEVRAHRPSRRRRRRSGPRYVDDMAGGRVRASAGVLVFGGVLSDRMPRNRVLVGASLLQGTAQAAMAAAVLSETATLPLFAALALLWGLGDGLILPAETGLVPQTVSAPRLQQANALQGLSRSG